MSKQNKVGRPRVEVQISFPEFYNAWKSKQITAVRFMTLFNLSKSTFYRMVEAYEVSMNLAKPQLLESINNVDESTAIVAVEPLKRNLSKIERVLLATNHKLSKIKKEQ